MTPEKSFWEIKVLVNVDNSAFKENPQVLGGVFKQHHRFKTAFVNGCQS